MTPWARLSRLRTLAATSLLVGSLGLAAASPVHAETVWFAALSGAAEVPGPGDPDADGLARITIDPAGGSVCVEWDIIDLEPATAAHIHSGGAGVAGPVIVALPAPETAGSGGDCVASLDEATLQAIVDDPAGHYVNVHNADFPSGAVRGQLDPVAVTQVSVAKAVCPIEIQTPDQLIAAPAGSCTIAADNGSIDPPSPGVVYDPEPLMFDMQVTLEDDGGTLTLDEAELDGGGTCGPTTCSISRSYLWSDVFVGPTSVTEETFPDGYHFGWAIVRSATDGGPAPEGTVDVGSATISFDTTGFGYEGQLSIVLYDLADVAAATPTPVPSAPPGGSVAPTTFSPPPTDAEFGVAREVPSLAPFLTIVGAIGAAVVLALRRRPDRH